MGFFVSILYLVTHYLTPYTLFGPLGAYRIELILAILALLISLFKLPESFVLKTPQALALLGLSFAIFMSVAVGRHWIAGGAYADADFIPNPLAYFLVCLHFNSVKKLKAVVLMLLVVCLFVISQGVMELQTVGSGPQGGDTAEIEERLPPYLFAMKSESGDWFYRIRGLGEINDPNDFAQLIVSVLPLLFIFWKRKRTFRNIVCVLLPVSCLMYGAYLTHSRGSMLALGIMFIVAARRRIGTVPSLVLAAGLFVAASTLNFTGGREISASAGEDRTLLWGTGLQLLKSHPFFGVGFNQMPEYAGLTAHNSAVVCAAELGLVGLFFWSLFLVTSLRDSLVLASPTKVSEGEPIKQEVVPFPLKPETVEEFDKSEANSLGRLFLLSFTGLLVTGWFLSRAFVMTTFLLGGIVEVTFEMALRRGMVVSRLPFGRSLSYAGRLAILLVLMMWVMLRVLHVLH